MNRREWINVLGLGGAGLAAGGTCAGADDHQPPGAGDKYMGAGKGFHHHFCGIHVAKNNVNTQIVTQHYCILGKKVHQCLLFESFEEGSKLLGVEYIIPDEIYQGLPVKEKMYWHPHAFEVMGGGLIAPSMKKEDELKFMGVIMNTWGKTWHTWPKPEDEVPMGDPLLMWSLGSDKQVNRGVVAARDAKFGVNTQIIRDERAKEFGHEVPDVDFPKMDEAGHQWYATGEDKPKKKK